MFFKEEQIALCEAFDEALRAYPHNPDLNTRPGSRRTENYRLLLNRHRHMRIYLNQRGYVNIKTCFIYVFL